LLCHVEAESTLYSNANFGGIDNHRSSAIVNSLIGLFLIHDLSTVL